jgi:hypothetical protein
MSNELRFIVTLIFRCRLSWRSPRHLFVGGKRISRVKRAETLCTVPLENGGLLDTCPDKSLDWIKSGRTHADTVYCIRYIQSSINC